MACAQLSLVRRLTAALLLVSAASAASAQERASGWPPAELAEKLKAAPKTDVDKAIKELITEYEAKIAALNADEPVVKAGIPRLREKLTPFYLEYNRNKKRYRRDHFTPAECANRFKADMGFRLTALAAGEDPAASSAGKWQTRVAWIERTNVMGHYDLIVPKAYEPKKSWPIIISYQDDPNDKEIRKTPYFLIRCVQKGYPTGLTYVENKTRTYLKDVAREYNIDPTRVYATGFSYGGHTDLVVAWRFPHWFAAIAPVCSDLRDKQTPYVKQLKNVPTLLLHGAGDSFLATGKVVHKYMKEAGCPVEWRTYPGGHAPTLPFRQDVTVLTNFFDKHVMNPYPKMVCHIVEHNRYSRAFWVDAKLTKNSGGMEAIFEVRVKDGNKIEIDANEQVAELDLYLNDKLIDMGKPVTVVTGQRKLYEGKPTEKLTIKLTEAPDYSRDGGDTLWRQLAEIRKQARPAAGVPR